MVEDVHDRSFFIYTDIEARNERDVSYYHSETDRDKQQRLPVFLDRQIDEYDADEDHNGVFVRHTGEACVLEELLKTFKYGVH